MSTFHVGAVAAFFIDARRWPQPYPLLSRPDVGIGMGYHQLLTHGGYQGTYRGVEYPADVVQRLALKRAYFHRRIGSP